MKVFGVRGLPHEHRQSEVAAGLIEEAVDETRFLFRLQLALPQLVVVALLENAARGQRAAGERVADAEAEEIVLKPRRLADEARAVRRRRTLEMEIHVRIAGARIGRYLEIVDPPRRGQRVIEVRVDLLEVRHDGAAEGGHAVEDEEV